MGVTPSGDFQPVLELVILYAEKKDAKFERAACRWLGRLTAEQGQLTLADAQLAASALIALPAATAAVALRALVT